MTEVHQPLQILRAAGEGHCHSVFGMRHEYKARPSEGAPTLTFVMDIPPGCGAPLHAHERDGEAFYILEGALTFITPGSSRVAGPGGFFYAGPGHVHAFVNGSGEPARALIIQTPGIDAERFFESMAEADLAPCPETMEQLLEIARRHGTVVLPQQA